MLYISYSIITVIYSILVCVFGSIYCLFSPRNPKHVAIFGHMLSRLASLSGLKVEYRELTDVESYGNVIHIANHQNSYNMVTTSDIVQLPTVAVGKKNLLWILFFGQLYWLADNLSIGRNNRTKAHGIITEVVNHFKKCRISTWIFPKGTRGHGRDLLSFKIRAFHAAVTTGVPIIPVCISTASNKINLSRPHDGLVIVETLLPINVSQCDKDQVRELTVYCRLIVEQKIIEPDKEITERETAGKV